MLAEREELEEKENRLNAVESAGQLLNLDQFIVCLSLGTGR